jgi:hypothetical protein
MSPVCSAANHFDHGGSIAHAAPSSGLTLSYLSGNRSGYDNSCGHCFTIPDMALLGPPFRSPSGFIPSISYISSSNKA